MLLFHPKNDSPPSASAALQMAPYKMDIITVTIISTILYKLFHSIKRFYSGNWN